MSDGRRKMVCCYDDAFVQVSVCKYSVQGRYVKEYCKCNSTQPVIEKKNINRWTKLHKSILDFLYEIFQLEMFSNLQANQRFHKCIR